MSFRRPQADARPRFGYEVTDIAELRSRNDEAAVEEALGPRRPLDLRLVAEQHLKSLGIELSGHSSSDQGLAMLGEEVDLILQKQLGPTQLVRRTLNNRGLRIAQVSRNLEVADLLITQMGYRDPGQIRLAVGLEPR